MRNLHFYSLPHEQWNLVCQMENKGMKTIYDPYLINDHGVLFLVAIQSERTHFIPFSKNNGRKTMSSTSYPENFTLCVGG